MKRINEIQEDLTVIQPKIDLGKHDWNVKEKKSIENAYSEITKVSTGTARSLDLGCVECVGRAVHIIKNYQKLVAASEEAEGTLKVVENDWKETVKTVDAKAAELQITWSKKKMTKDEKIAEVEAFAASAHPYPNEADADDDLLGENYTDDQLLEVIKAKTGEEFDPATYAEFDNAALLAEVKRLEAEEDATA